MQQSWLRVRIVLFLSWAGNEEFHPHCFDLIKFLMNSEEFICPECEDRSRKGAQRGFAVLSRFSRPDWPNVLVWSSAGTSIWWELIKICKHHVTRQLLPLPSFIVFILLSSRKPVGQFNFCYLSSLLGGGDSLSPSCCGFCSCTNS